MDEAEQERYRTARKMALKLASNKSKQRTVRKLPQTMVVLPTPKFRNYYPGREVLLRNKRLAYIMLLGAVMCAYTYDLDQDRMAEMMQTVNVEAEAHFGVRVGGV